MAHGRVPSRTGAPRRSPDHRRRADRVHPNTLPPRTETADPRSRRTPPPEGYEGDFTRDQEALREEQLVRRTVFMEFSRRLAAAESSKAGHKKSQHAVPPISPMWADLRFDFGSAPIFLPATATALSERRFRLRSLLRSSGLLRRNLPR